MATDGGLEHHSVAATVLRAGDLVVVSTSDILPAALGGVASDGQRVEMHLSTLDPVVTLSYPVITVGTTVVRALESAADGRSGWTDLVVTPERDGMLTGWHEPAASHLRMLGALAGPDLLAASYAETLRAGYRWHEFGDVHLILPSG